MENQPILKECSNGHIKIYFDINYECPLCALIKNKPPKIQSLKEVMEEIN